MHWSTKLLVMLGNVIARTVSVDFGNIEPPGWGDFDVFSFAQDSPFHFACAGTQEISDL